jgi:hypothetical protein
MIDIISEFIQIILKCLDKLIDIQTTFLTTLAIAVLLAIGCWLFCNYYSRLWNTRYRITFTHHVLCAIAAIFTFIGVMVYQSLEYIAPVTQTIVDTCQQNLKDDNSWSQNTFRKAYEEVKAMGKEDFSSFPHPDAGGSIIPSKYDETRNKIALVYSTEAVSHFKGHHPYLDKILWATSTPSEQAIYQDHKDFFMQEPKPDSYPLERAINLAARMISDELSEQIPRVVSLSRLTIVLLFLLMQAIPFSLIGWSAYRDLKVTV